MTDLKKEYIGSLSQLFDVRQYTLSDGKAAGTKAVDIWNGGGLHFTVLPDRCMDILSVRFNNRNISYLSPNGVTAPAYFDDMRWLRSFYGGFLATCGLQSIGAPDDSDRDLTVHGRIGNQPAENFSVELSNGSDGGAISVRLKGTMREAVIFGAKLSLTRTIYCEYGKDEIILEDEIANEGFRREPLSLLYHFNLGYPLIAEGATLYVPSDKIEPRNARAAEGLDYWDKILSPETSYEEMCYYHTLREKSYGVDNKDIGVSVRFGYESDILTNFVQWKMFGKGDYVMGLEPSTSTLEGRINAIRDGSQKYIDGQSKYKNTFKINFKNI